jgi:hypothetical protein
VSPPRRLSREGVLTTFDEILPVQGVTHIKSPIVGTEVKRGLIITGFVAPYATAEKYPSGKGIASSTKGLPRQFS